MGNKALDAVLASPPLTKLPGIPRVSPAAQEVFKSIEELANQQAADLPASATPFQAVEIPVERGVSFSFSLNPEKRTFDFRSPHSLRTTIENVEGQIKGTINF